MFPQNVAAEQCEKLGRFSDAAAYYGKFLNNVKASVASGNDSYRDYLKTVPYLITHNTVAPTVYAKTKSTSNIPYYGAKNEPEAGTYHGMCDVFDTERDSAFLLYVSFGNEDIGDYEWIIPKGNPDLVLTVAWNVPNETLTDLQDIVSGLHDEYIERNLEYLASLKCRVMIRFGAEVNCWLSLPHTRDAYEKDGKKFTETFKNAFRKISTAAKRICPEAAMVYSPNDISNWHFDHTDFYPGDEYVDWVGMSSYGNVQKDAVNVLASQNDAFYCRGCYENQLTKIKSIVDAYGDRKPIIITECGFCYSSSTNNIQTQEHALSAMRFFFTYLDMVYPQVKAVCYFNTNYGGNCYALFNRSGVANEGLANLYQELVSSDPAMEYSLGRGDYCGYTEIGNIDEITDSLDMSVYAWYPGNKTVTVEYYLDSVSQFKTTDYPYSFSIGTDNLSVGTHLLTVTVNCMSASTRCVYTVERNEDGRITVKDATPSGIKDVKATDWFYDNVAYCIKTGLLAGVGGGKFEPYTKLNRAMFVTILGRLSGVDVSGYTSTPFSDVKAGEWYAPYVAWAKETGVVNGVSKTRFDPLANVTREQICVMLTRYADQFGIELPGGDGNIGLFADDNKISEWAKDAVYRARGCGLVNGKGNNMFDPLASATRAEGAAIFMRFVLMIRGSRNPQSNLPE